MAGQSLLWNVSLGVGLLLAPFGAKSLGVTPASVSVPEAPESITPTVTSRAKVEIAIKRIRSLLIVEKGQNEDTFDALGKAQKDLQGRR